MVAGSPLTNRRVLIVDDNELLRTGLAKLVGMHGHEAITAATIAAGMEQLGVPPAQLPSHLLLDMNLPDGVGTTILRRIRAEHLPIKVAVVSGSGDAELMAEARSLRPDAMFQKPPDWGALMDWIGA